MIGAITATLWVNATDLDLVAVLAAHADAQHDATGRTVGERCELTSDSHRMSKR